MAQENTEAVMFELALSALWLLSPGQDGHQGALTCLASNKDGSLVLTGSVDGYATLINTATGKVGARETRQQTGNGKAVQTCP